jgi:aspartate/methionine/tyrosine aminotransferase
MKIDRFDMERFQCLYENEVEFNLSESGVLPLSLGELVPGRAARAALDARRLKYPHASGRRALRENVARFYGGADPDSVMVTNGGSEANYVVLWGLVDDGARVAFMLPNYMQGFGLARAYGRRADAFHLVMDLGAQGGPRWRLDLESLARAVKPDTRVVMVTNPNNPTGSVLSEAEMAAVVAAARRVGAWLVCDEIYRGAETAGPLTPSFWGRYEKVVITSGLSKAFGLPGLRTGWIMGPPALIRRLAHHHDYLTLTPSFLSEDLADRVMRPRRRDEILRRTRGILRQNLPVLEDWIASHADVFEYLRPQAGAIALLRYHLPIASETLFHRLRRERSVLVTPGAHFGIGRYFRVGYGYDAKKLRRGLREISLFLRGLPRGRRIPPGRPPPRGSDRR